MVASVNRHPGEDWRKLGSGKAHDHFLDLGGHSLLATQIIDRVIRTFQVNLPVSALFDSPTPAEMAFLIVLNRARRVGQEDVDRMLAELETLSDEEARKRLADSGP